MDFDWTEHQAKLRQGAIEFASRQLCEGAMDRDREGMFPRQLWKACAEFGLQGILVPEEMGGGGHDLLSVVATLEGIGYGARDNVFALTAHIASCESAVARFGSDSQKENWLPRLANGSVIGASAVTEPESGSSALSLKTTAVESRGDWVLDGCKTFVTNAPVADLFVVYARTGGPGLAGVTCFLIPRAIEGLRIGPPMVNMGLRSAPISEIFLDNCRVPTSAVLGSIGSGAMVFNQTIDIERVLTMAPAIGVMERLVERCVEHARERAPGGIPIAKHQAIAHRIADMELELEGARWLLYRAAWRQAQRGTSTRESALAKLAVSEAYVRACRSALQIFGGYGYMADYELERELRDALATTLYVGTSEVQRNLIAGLRGLG